MLRVYNMKQNEVQEIAAAISPPRRFKVQGVQSSRLPIGLPGTDFV
jgi:hypothetical protein